MPQLSAVVIFTSRCGRTEETAHAAAVGVVNARALPRLRRLADDADAAPPECGDTLRRMQKEYVAPTTADIINSPALILVPSRGMVPSHGAWHSWLTLLDGLASAGNLSGKVAAVIDAGDASTVAAFSSELARCGFRLIPAKGRDARAHGRAVAEAIGVGDDQRMG
jgi:hypothetical protein